MFVDEKRHGELVIETDDTLKILSEARDLLRRGWIQNLSKTEDGVCTFGAFRVALGPDRYDVTESWDKVCKYLKPIMGASPIGWNDTVGRTQAEVISAFNRAIELRKADLNVA